MNHRTTLLVAATLLTSFLPLHAAPADKPVAGGTTAPSGTPCIGSDGMRRDDSSAASGAPDTGRINPPGTAELACDDRPPMPGQQDQPNLGTGKAPKPNKPLRDSTGTQADEPVPQQ